jgi:murein DD-endopeptidase MepM/ murein hydrolase activator NlpD
MNAMNRVLIFLAGAISGLAGAFIYIAARAPESVTVQVAACPPAVVAPPQNCLEPVAAEAVAAPTAAELAPNPGPAAEQPLGAQPLASKTQAAQPAGLLSRPQPGSLMIPVAGVEASQLSDTFTDARGNGRVHDAIDIMAPTGTPVIAADDGRVVKLFNSVPGGLTVYQFDPREKFTYYYAHLDRYAPGLVEGKILKRGELLGYVGYSGNASPAAPHLHFAISELGPEKRWWQGTAINPYPYLTGR